MLKISICQSKSSKRPQNLSQSWSALSAHRQAWARIPGRYTPVIKRGWEIPELNEGFKWKPNYTWWIFHCNVRFCQRVNYTKKLVQWIDLRIDSSQTPVLYTAISGLPVYLPLNYLVKHQRPYKIDIWECTTF